MTLASLLLVVVLVYAVGYLAVAAYFLWLTRGLGIVGALASFWAARRWPLDLIDRLTAPRERVAPTTPTRKDGAS